MVEKLLEAGADINQTNRRGFTPLAHSVHSNQHELAAQFLKAGADVNQADKIGCSPLFAASMTGGDHAAMVERLLEAGADVNQAERYGGTPLYIASEKGHTEVVERLLRGGAFATARAKNGKTALDMARERNKEGVVALLEGWLTVMTLRTLCQQAITRKRVDWQSLLPPVLMEPIDEVAEHRSHQQIEEERTCACLEEE